jgi:hypothetical protein
MDRQGAGSGIFHTRCRISKANYGRPQIIQVEPGTRVKLKDVDPGYKGKHISEEHVKEEIKKNCAELAKQQYLLYSDRTHSLLIVLQALDAAGKDGTMNHVMSAMNPQGTVVTGFGADLGGRVGPRLSLRDPMGISAACSSATLVCRRICDEQTSNSTVM